VRNILYICFRCYFIPDTSAPPFDLNLPLYQPQLNKDLAINVYSDGKWGSYRHLPLDSGATVSVPHAYVSLMRRGDLSSFRWLEGNLDPGRCGLAMYDNVLLSSSVKQTVLV
jgi:fatty acid synthase